MRILNYTLKTTLFLFLSFISFNLSAQTETTFLVDYTENNTCGINSGCDATFPGGTAGQTYACNDDIELAAFPFIDPVAPGQIITSISIDFIGGCNPNGVEMTYLLNGTVLDVQSGFLTNCQCDCPATAARTFTYSNPNGIPGYIYGGTNNLEFIYAEAGISTICAYYSELTFTSINSLEIECRQPVSATTSTGECGAIDLVVLDPFVLESNTDVTFSRIPAGNNFPVGETTLMWTGTDEDGNTKTCESLVIVTDSEFPTVSSCNTEIDFVDPGSCFAQVNVTADIFDNCGVASIEGLGSFSLPYGSYSNPITVTDVNGNVTVHDFTIYIHDALLPEFQNCPTEMIVLQAGANGTANYPSPSPLATDNCGSPTISNDLPAGGLPIGNSLVTFVAEDAYGNTSECIVDIEVTGGILMHPIGNIEASLTENQTAQTIAWNALNASTFCELCEETNLEGFRYIGTWWGHQYFLADEASLTRDEANLIAEGFDAHLAVINDAAENTYLTEALDDEIRSAWIGLMPQLEDGEWTFVWDNDEVLDFEALVFDEINADTRIILGNDGTWKNATDTEDKFFLIERPCVNFVQTGPIYTPEIETPGTLLRSGDIWPQGEYEVSYTLTDMCGNESVMTFDVDVLPEVANYCTISGTENNIWVENFVFHELENTSENDEGYADFSEEITTMNIGNGVILVKMSAGGNEAEDMLYWNIYLDANADGDFFDAGEMLYEVVTREDIEANLTLPTVAMENVRLRVMVSRYAFAAPCGDTYVGEIEDYSLNLLIPEVLTAKPNKPMLYPNPASTHVNLSLVNNKKQSGAITIYNNLGQIKLIQYFDENSGDDLSIDLDELTTGVYFVSIQGDDKSVQTQRLVISRSNHQVTAN